MKWPERRSLSNTGNRFYSQRTQISPLMSKIRNRHLFHYCSNTIVFLIRVIHTWRNTKKRTIQNNSYIPVFSSSFHKYDLSQQWRREFYLKPKKWIAWYPSWYSKQLDSLLPKHFLSAAQLMAYNISQASSGRQGLGSKLIAQLTTVALTLLSFYLSLNPKLLQTKTIRLQSKSRY